MFEVKVVVEAPGLEKLAEAILDLSVALRNQGVADKAPRKRAAAAAEPASNVVELPVSKPESAPAPAAPPAESGSKATIEAVREALKAVIVRYGDEHAAKVKGRAEAAAILEKHGVTSVSALKPEQFASVIAESQKVLGS